MEKEMLYTINLHSFKKGKNQIEFLLDKPFFVEQNKEEWYGGEVKVKIILEKQSDFLSLHFDMVGFIEFACDRCLDLVSLPVEYKSDLWIRYEASVDDEQVIVIDKNDNIVDLTHYLYESIMISLPLQKAHINEVACNQEMILLLSRYKESNEKTDPRWDTLKKILNKK